MTYPVAHGGSGYACSHFQRWPKTECEDVETDFRPAGLQLPHHGVVLDKCRPIFHPLFVFWSIAMGGWPLLVCGVEHYRSSHLGVCAWLGR